MKWLIHRYILRALLVPFGLSLLVFTFTFFIYRVFQLTEMVVNRGMMLSDVVRVLVYASPYFFMFTIPMAVLFAVVLTFIKLTTDNEILALKAAGVSLYRLLPPVYVLVFFGFMLTLLTSTYFVPRGNTAMADLIFKMTSSRADIAVRERIFIEDFEGISLYIESVDTRTGELKNVFVYDDRDPDVDSAITAESGLLLRDEARREVVLRLFNGSIDRLQRNWSRTQTITFATYDLKVNAQDLAAARRSAARHRSEYTMGELAEFMRQKKGKDPKGYMLMATIFHERLAIPFACIVLGLLAVPLGMGSRSGSYARSRGVVLGVLAFLSYYLLYSLFRGFGDKGLLPVWVSLWIPNLMFLVMTLVLTRRSARERPLGWWDRLQEFRLWTKLTEKED